MQLEHGDGKLSNNTINGFETMLHDCVDEAVRHRNSVNKYSPDELRDSRGEFTSGELKQVEQRVFTRLQVATQTRLSKLETGEIGEKIALQFVKSQLGLPDAQALHAQASINLPADLIADHELFEIKTGLVSNGSGAQQWRATIGQPGKQETEWLKHASP